MTVGIRGQLLAGFGAVLFLLAVVGGIGWRNTATSSTAFANLYDHELTQLEDLSGVMRLLYELRLGAMGPSYGTSDASQRALAIASDNQRLALIDATMRRVAANNLSIQERQGIATWDQTYPAFLAARSRVIALVDQGRAAEAAPLRTSDGNNTLAQQRTR